MTLSLLLQQPRKTLSIALCRHHALNKTMQDRVREALRRGSWTCHVCGVHLPGLMEIDHFDNHEPGSCGRIAPICQFCHDLKHPLWSAPRVRLVPVMVPPEIDQRTLTRLSWIIIARCVHDPQNVESLVPVIRDLKRCRIDDSSVFGLPYIGDVFESLLTVAEFSGVDCAEEILQYLQPRMRFLPFALIDVNALREPGPAGYARITTPVLRKATRRPFARDEAEAVIARFMPREEGAGAGAQDDSDSAASCDSDCGPDCDAGGDADPSVAGAASMGAAPAPQTGVSDIFELVRDLLGGQAFASDPNRDSNDDCDAGGDTDPPGAEAANKNAAPAPQTEAPGVSEPRCGPQGAQASASDPNRDSNDEGMEP